MQCRKISLLIKHILHSNLHLELFHRVLELIRSVIIYYYLYYIMKTSTNQIKRTKVLKFKTTFSPTTMTHIICFWYISINTRLSFFIGRCPAGRYEFYFYSNTVFLHVCVKSNVRTRFVMDCCFSQYSNNTSAQHTHGNNFYLSYTVVYAHDRIKTGISAFIIFYFLC